MEGGRTRDREPRFSSCPGSAQSSLRMGKELWRSPLAKGQDGVAEGDGSDEG